MMSSSSCHYSNCTLSRRLLFGLVKDEARGDLHCARMLSDTLFRVFIECRLDWCNSLLYGVPENLLRKVQSVQNAAARLLTNTRHRDHITPFLRQLHWLPIQRRVEFKIACMAHQSLTSTAPTYLSADIHWSLSMVDVISAHLPTEHSLFHAHVPLSATEVLLSQHRARVWNSLPATLRQITSYGQFRQRLKTHLFRA